MENEIFTIREVIIFDDNDKCVDCNMMNPLWISLKNRTFMCDHCKEIHQNVINPQETYLHVHLNAPFSQNIIDQLLGTGNSWFNEKYEKNIPKLYQKPDENSCREHRLSWILDKYKYKKFITNHS